MFEIIHKKVIQDNADLIFAGLAQSVIKGRSNIDVEEVFGLIAFGDSVLFTNRTKTSGFNYFVMLTLGEDKDNNKILEVNSVFGVGFLKDLDKIIDEVKKIGKRADVDYIFSAGRNGWKRVMKHRKDIKFNKDGFYILIEKENDVKQQN